MVTKLQHTVFYEETLMGYVLRLAISFNGKYLKRYILDNVGQSKQKMLFYIENSQTH